jgi:hypothetical protein
VVTVRHNWGVLSQVYYHAVDGRLRGIPLAWTSLFPEDPVVTFGTGRVPFRLTDLMELARLVDQLREGVEDSDITSNVSTPWAGGVK